MGLPKPVESRSPRRLQEEEVQENKSADKKKKAVSKEVPEHEPARRRAGRGSEASAIDVETSGHIEDQRAEKSQQQEIAGQDRSRQPDSQDQTQAYQQLGPGQEEGDEVYQHVWKNLVIVNDLSKWNRVKDLVIAGVDKDSSQEQTR